MNEHTNILYLLLSAFGALVALSDVELYLRVISASIAIIAGIVSVIDRTHKIHHRRKTKP